MRAVIVSVSVLLFSTEVFLWYVELEWVTLLTTCSELKLPVERWPAHPAVWPWSFGRFAFWPFGRLANQ